MIPRRQGFTLIEMLVALTLLTILVMVVFVSLNSVISATEMMRDLSRELRFRQILQENLFTNFSTVYADSACVVTEYQFLGENGETMLGPADSVSFCTSQPMSGPYALPGIFKVVSYEVGEVEEDGGDGSLAYDMDRDYLDRKPSVMLTITERPLVLSSLNEERDSGDYEALGTSRQVPVRSFDVLYYDIESEDWVEDWDSLETNRLPWAVWIRIDFPRSEAEYQGDLEAGIEFGETADLDVTIPLAAGMGVVDRFLDMNHLGTDLIDDPDGIFREQR